MTLSFKGPFDAPITGRDVYYQHAKLMQVQRDSETDYRLRVNPPKYLILFSEVDVSLGLRRADSLV